MIRSRRKNNPRGWDGMGWDGMGWDGMGWDGMGWDDFSSKLRTKTYTIRHMYVYTNISYNKFLFYLML